MQLERKEAATLRGRLAVLGRMREQTGLDGLNRHMINELLAGHEK